MPTNKDNAVRHSFFTFWRNVYLLWRYRKILRRCYEVVVMPKAPYSRAVSQNLTLEEMEGVSDMERFYRLTHIRGKILRSDLKHLKKALDI